jgi:uncharacterized iron-regulated membrane protein
LTGLLIFMFSTAQTQSQTTRMVNMRRLWLKAHRWLALGIGWLLALVALTGAILVVAPWLDRLLNPQLFKAEQGAAASSSAAPTLESIREQMIAGFGSKASFTLRLPRASGETLRVSVRGEPWSGTVYLNPATGQEQGRRGEYEGFVPVLFKFHSALLLKETGKAILAWTALAYLTLLVSGLALWWPKRWPPVLKIELRKGLLRSVFDLHRTGGAVLGVLIAVSVATGAYMAWRPLGEFVTMLSGAKPVKPPKIPKEEAGRAAAIPLDALVASAQARFPHDTVRLIQVPSEAGRPVRVRLRVADDPHPNGLTSVWLHPATGDVLAVNRWNELDPGARAISFVFPLHTGELGGVFLEALTFISGLALGMLGISGIWLWWRRRT